MSSWVQADYGNAFVLQVMATKSKDMPDRQFLGWTRKQGFVHRSQVYAIE